MKILKCITDEQIQSIAILAKEIWHEYFEKIIGRDQVNYMVEKFQSYNGIKQAIENGYIYLYIVDEENNILGYTGFKLEEKKLFLSKLYIKKQYRGKGFSKILFNEIIKISKEYNVPSIYLTVNKHNERTIEIYKKMGFQIVESVVTD
ncbi:MAG: GNAT family N-acetyltransferase, partial [Oscillospiraceae bacterium]